MSEISLDNCPLRNARFQMILPNFSLSIRMVDYYQFDYGKVSNEIHYHDCFELVYLLEGKGSFICGNEEFTLCKNDLFISDPNQPHEIHIAQNETLTILYLMFKIDSSGRVPGHLTGDEKTIKSFMESHENSVHNQSSLVTYIHFFENYAATGGDLRGLWLKRTFESFLLHSLDSLCTKKISKEKEQISEESLLEKALDFIDKNLPNKFTADDIARNINTSKRNLYRLFRLYLDRTVHDYIKEKKIRLSETYLEMNYSVSQTASLIGIENLSQFSKLFKQYIGMSPMAYKKQNIEQRGGYGRRYQ